MHSTQRLGPGDTFDSVKYRMHLQVHWNCMHVSRYQVAVLDVLGVVVSWSYTDFGAKFSPSLMRSRSLSFGSSLHDACMSMQLCRCWTCMFACLPAFFLHPTRILNNPMYDF